jgi:hypothetical protein
MSWARRHRTILACAGLAALVILIGLPAHRASMPDRESKGAGLLRQAERPLARDTTSGVYVMAAPARPAAQAVAPRSQAPPLPFSFLGKMTEGAETSIILYRGGRTITVRGPGRLDDDYVVESIQETFLALRYLPLGEQQFLELTALQDPTPYGSAAETPQD